MEIPESAMMSPSQSLREAFGVDQHATIGDLHKAFAHRALRAHPTNGGSKGAFDAIMAAFETLVESAVRRRLDSEPSLNADATAPHAATAVRPALSVLPTGHRCSCCALRTGSVRDGRRLSKDAFCERLYNVLRQLPPETRRHAIARRLNSAQRARLELWMLQRRALQTRSCANAMGPHDTVSKAKKTGCPSNARVDSLVVGKVPRPRISMRSLCQHKTRNGRSGYHPSAHIGSGLYAHAAFSYDVETAVAALGVIIVMRSFVAAAGARASSGSVGVRLAVAEAVRECDVPRAKFYFRTRLAAFGRGELSSRMKGDLEMALMDWEKLHTARDSLQASAAGAEARSFRTMGSGRDDLVLSLLLGRLDSVLQHEDRQRTSRSKRAVQLRFRPRRGGVKAGHSNPPHTSLRRPASVSQSVRQPASQPFSQSVQSVQPVIQLVSQSVSMSKVKPRISRNGKILDD